MISLQERPFPKPAPAPAPQPTCRTGFLLCLILLGTAVLSVDRYLTNDALRRVEDVEAWGIRETAQIIAVDQAQARAEYAVVTNAVLAGQVKLLQERLDMLSLESVKLLHENMILKEGSPIVAPPMDKPDQET